MVLGIFQKKTNVELENLINRTKSSMQNNYKDMAQDYFKEFCKKYNDLIAAGSLNDKQKAYYADQRDSLTEELKGFTHKDQKPYWY